MQLLSTKYHSTNGFSELSTNQITTHIKNCLSLTIISAYYSSNFIEKLLNNINKSKRKNCNITLIFNGFGGEKLSQQINDLRNLTKNLEAMGFKKTTCHINKENQIFHSKLYFIENTEGSIWFIGSANASNAAFEQNEEILLEGKTHIKKITSYIEEVIESSPEISTINPTTSRETSLIGLLKTGSMFFRPNNQISFTFSELKIPKNIEEILVKDIKTPRHVNPGKAWGPYNLKYALGLSETDSDDTVRAIIKPWSIETCYGYWIPHKYICEINFKLQHKKEAMKRELLRVKSSIDDKGIKNLVNDYEKHIEDIRNILSEKRIALNTKEDLGLIIKKYENFINNIYRKLSNSHTLEKLSSPFISATMPEIWEDDLAKNEFIQSFFENTSYALSIQSKNYVINSFKTNLPLHSSDDAEAIKNKFETYFEGNNTWSDDNWVIKTR